MHSVSTAITADPTRQTRLQALARGVTKSATSALYRPPDSVRRQRIEAQMNLDMIHVDQRTGE